MLACRDMDMWNIGMHLPGNTETIKNVLLDIGLYNGGLTQHTLTLSS